MSDLFEWINNTTKAGGLFKDLLEILVIVAKGVASAILTIVLSIEVLVQAADLAMSEVIDILSGNLGKAKTDFETFQASVLASSTSWMKRMQALWGQATTPAEVNKKAAPSIDLNQSGASSAAKELDAEIKVLEAGLQQKKSLLDQEVAQHKITQQQKFISLQDYTDDAYEDEKALLEKELALYGQGTTQYAAVKAKLLELDAKYALDSQKIATDNAKAQQKTYDDFFKTVEGAFNSQLKGLLAGTTSWSQAFKNILGDLVIKFIEAIEKMGFEWVAGELAKTAATTAGVTARTGAEVAGATVSSAATYASIFKSIMASAQQTFAGIFGFLSPVMGPAAAAPAVAGEATVAAAAAAIPSLDVGTPWVASSGLAMIHQGEAVVPASVNGAWQGGAGASPISVHLHLDGGINDGASLARFWKDNARNIASAVANHVNLNPSAAR